MNIIYGTRGKKALFFCVIFLSLFAVLFNTPSSGQSTDQINPTPIVSNEVNGQIKARDIGDSRLTTFYYTFNGKRGDIFINVLTKNLNGDIEVFTTNSLKSRTKITIYADNSDSETGRVIYMRKPEPLILRVQGRTPDDDPATFQIKFAGSFAPMAVTSKDKSNELPEIDTNGRDTVRVNSVGTIIEDKVDSETQPKDLEIEKPNEPKKEVVSKKRSEIPEKFDPRKKEERTKTTLLNERPRVIISDPFDKEKSVKPEGARKPDLTVKIKKPPPRSALVTIERVPEKKVEDSKKTFDKRKALSKIRLVIVFKNGKRFSRRMSKVASVNVFDGVLKVVEIDGTVNKFSIFDIEKTTIE